MTRSSATLILERIISNLVNTVVVYVALIAVIATTSGWVRTLLILVVLYYTYTRVYLAVYDLIAVRWEIEPSSFAYTRGLIFPETTRIAVEDILGIQLTQSALQRLFKRWEVHLQVAAGDVAVPVLHSVPRWYVEELSQRLNVPIEKLTPDKNGNNKPPPVDDSTPSQTTIRYDDAATENPSGVPQEQGVQQSLVHLKGKDFWAISFTYGKFVLLLPLILTLLNRLTDLNVVGTLKLGLVNATSDITVLLGGVLVLVVTSSLYGALVAYFKYGNFHLNVTDQGIYTSRGIVSSVQRTIRFDMVDAVELHQNLLMRFLNLFTLRVVARGDNPQSEATRIVVIPVGTKQEIYSFLGEHLTPYMASHGKVVVDSGYLVPTAASLGAGLVVGGSLSAWMGNPLSSWWSVVILIISALAAYVVLQQSSQQVSWSSVNQTWKIRKGRINQRYWHVPSQSLISTSRIKVPLIQNLATQSFRIGGTIPKTVYGWGGVPMQQDTALITEEAK